MNTELRALLSLLLTVSCAHFFYAAHGWEAVAWGIGVGFNGWMFVNMLTVHVIRVYSAEFVKQMNESMRSEKR